MELLLLYKFSIATSSLSSICLPIVGHHFFHRKKILELFALSQVVVTGKLFVSLFIHDYSALTSLLTSCLFFLFGYIGINKIRIKKNMFEQSMIGIFLTLTSIQYFIIGYFPQLDSHMRNGLFGNIVTLTDQENFITSFGFVLFVILYGLYSKFIHKQTLEVSLFNRTSSRLAEVILLLPIIISLFSLGFLYSLSFLLLPSLLTNYQFKSNKSTFQFFILMSLFASTGGLVLSILIPKLSTTALQVLLLIIGSFLVTRLKSKA